MLLGALLFGLLGGQCGGLPGFPKCPPVRFAPLLLVSFAPLLLVSFAPLLLVSFAPLLLVSFR